MDLANNDNQSLPDVAQQQQQQQQQLHDNHQQQHHQQQQKQQQQQQQQPSQQQPENSDPSSESNADANNPEPVSTNDLETGHQTSSADPQAISKTNILDAINDFDSSIPDVVVNHFIRTNDKRISKLVAVAAQKFIHDIVSDSLQHSKLRAQGKKTKDKKFTLTIEDLSSALAEYGIEVRRQPYFN